ncbi:GMC family oxidoreductase [Bradyrhizobium elkanii]|uniref:GMC family oxidoreductase n=1 Tax=Bradyrhizobium elkanii TaxID=29448 RepID=UPI00086E11B5|nr:GMC family oxidoreductase [Bradyrhizobium elkanii]ODM71859.1 hypothetical protein A6452_06395 [Bradyrhizobium elkanii]
MTTGKTFGMTYDVVIIGSGIAGALVAYKLAMAKMRVLVLEAGGVPQEMGERRLLVKNFAASASKGADAPYTDEIRSSRYYSSPPAVTAPQPQDEPIGNDEPYYKYAQDNPSWNQQFRSYYERVVGGSTWHWQGLAPRMLPNDFRMRKAFFSDEPSSTHPGVRDWPISYSDLAAYYREAEYEMGISGNIVSDRELDDYFGVGRADAERGYPAVLREGIPMTYLDKYLREKLNGFHYEESAPDGRKFKMPVWVTQVAQAKNARPFDGRPACDGRGTCVPLCPTRAKYEAIFHIEKAVKAGAELQANAVVTKLEFGSSGEVANIVYQDWQLGTPRNVQGRIVVLAGNAIESPRLLLHSETPEKANKVIGKYLMDHPGSGSYGLVPDAVFPFRGPPTTSQIDTTRDGPLRKWRAGYRTSLLNYGWQLGSLRGSTFDPPPKLDHGEESDQHEERKADRGGNVLDLVHNNLLIGRKLKEKLQNHAHRQIFLGTALEQLPVAGNSVGLHSKADRFGVPLPLIKYYYDDDSGYTNAGLRAARAMHEAIFKQLRATAYRLFAFDASGALTGPGFFGAGHIMGTTRMGKEEEDRAVDAQCRSVDHPNLYIVGSSVFVTGAVANPTLTIAAISLRAADAIKAELRNMH